MVLIDGDVFAGLASARARGRSDRRRGVALEENPFDGTTEPARFAQWAEGWIVQSNASISK